MFGKCETSCLHDPYAKRHDWSKWETIDSGIAVESQYNSSTGITKWFDTQKRTCTLCGESELRTESAGLTGNIQSKEKKMMSQRQFYLLKLMEECNEVAQRAAKQMQFGPDESQASKTSPSEHKVPGTNAERLLGEVIDLLATIDILIDIGEMPWLSPWELLAAKNKKRQKIDKYLQYSQRLGRVSPVDRPAGLGPADEYVEPKISIDKQSSI